MAIAYLSNSQSDKNTDSNPKASEMNKETESSPMQFNGYDCAVDCSGHEAGYRWGEEHDITDGDNCDTAAERSNSPSFGEGCHSYVDGDSYPDINEGSSDDSDGGDEN